MFAIIRHAGYAFSSGSLTPEGRAAAGQIAQRLLGVPGWKEVRVSPTPRTRETGELIAERLKIPHVEDDRIGMDGDLSDLLPPTEAHGVIFVSHLPIITKFISKWSKKLGLEDLPSTDIAAGWIIDPDAGKITAA
ncbi:histidine phosphatase family protein [Candidatus Uhrbacteria bacterium]|nr:histidine phosphatase family protein [Candidatus Uhrbacteria bacterium]